MHFAELESREFVQYAFVVDFSCILSIQPKQYIVGPENEQKTMNVSI